MRARKLSLKRETLAELSSDEMAAVAGASHLCGVTDNCTHASIDDTCPTFPLVPCLSLNTCFVTN